MPRIDDILDSLGQDKFYSTVDLQSAYWSVPVAPQDRHKTAFITKEGSFEWISMPFGFQGAPMVFQRLSNAIITGLTKIRNFLDDFLVGSTTFEEHLALLGRLLGRFEEFKLAVNPVKCAICRGVFPILGFQATKDGLVADPDKVAAIQKLPFPTSRKEVQRFLGMVTWLRRFIPNLSAKTASLRRLISEGKKNIENETKE